MTPSAPLYEINRDENHVYHLMPEDRWLPGTTTVLDAKGKPFLAAWKVADLCERLGVKKATEAKVGWKQPRYTGGLWKPGVSYTADEIAKTVNEARAGAFKKSEKAKSIGTDAHSWVEAAIMAEIRGAQYPAMPTDPEAACSAMAWMGWREGVKVEWMASEQVVGSREHVYAGTLDALAMVGGKPYIIDVKTSAAVYSDYWVQVSAYLNAWREQFADDIPYERAVLRLPKDGKAAEWVVAPGWATHDLCWESFRGLLAVYRFDCADDAAREAGR